jgi:hypothetical protein
MTDAYLLLITVFNTEDIYINHEKEEFVIDINGVKNYVPLPSVTRFLSNKNNNDGK